jgi:hypothetical protein
MFIEFWHTLKDDDDHMWPVRVEAECTLEDGVIDWHVYAEADGADVVMNDRLKGRENMEIDEQVHLQWENEKACRMLRVGEYE